MVAASKAFASSRHTYLRSFGFRGCLAEPEQLSNRRKNLCSHKVAGCPPDYFSEDGQYWGNPLYDWQAHENDNYSWWIERLKASFRMHDACVSITQRIRFVLEHPIRVETAREGEWVNGPGIGFFKRVEKGNSDCQLIAEDLGELTPAFDAPGTTGLPGMSILQFAQTGETISICHTMYSRINCIRNS